MVISHKINGSDTPSLLLFHKICIFRTTSGRPTIEFHLLSTSFINQQQNNEEHVFHQTHSLCFQSFFHLLAHKNQGFFSYLTHIIRFINKNGKVLIRFNIFQGLRMIIHPNANFLYGFHLLLVVLSSFSYGGTYAIDVYRWHFIN